MEDHRTKKGRRVLLIPSAALLSDEMKSRMGDIPPILYPISGKTMLELICKRYKAIVDDIYLAVYEKKGAIKSFIQNKKIRVHVIELDQLGDIGHTIEYGIGTILKQGEEPIEKLYINYADTLMDIGSIREDADTLYYTYYDWDRRWSYLSLDQDRILRDIRCGKDNKELFDQGQKNLMFTGGGVFSNPAILQRLLKEAYAKRTESSESYYSALLEYSRQTPLKGKLLDEWLDIGHSENYQKTVKGVQAREFNSLEIDEKRGTIKKTSSNKQKFIDEINWYIKLPGQLQYMVPRIYDYSTEWANPYVRMEYYGYNTLHELYLYSELPKSQWRTIFEELLFILNDLKNYVVNDRYDEKHQSMKRMYIDKTLSRLDQIHSMNSILGEKKELPICINGKQYRSLREYTEIIPAIVNDLLLAGENQVFQIIHGDLCFTNILVENDLGFVRLLDPRGSFGTFDLYGDPRYETAKLLHSIQGGYDYIIEDMFEETITDNHIEFRLPDEKPYIKEIFDEVFQAELRRQRELELIEALLFLSMIPLHADAPDRQAAMLATGIQLLERVLSSSS